MNIEIPDQLKLMKLPPSVEMTLFLIGEEMKNRKSMNRLEEAGFNTTYASVDLSVLILSLIGFNPRSDELYEWYFESLDLVCHSVDPSDTDAWRMAILDFYIRLVSKKNKNE